MLTEKSDLNGTFRFTKFCNPCTDQYRRRAHPLTAPPSTMGIKRKRQQGPRFLSKDKAPGPTLHARTLGDEVQEARDLEFAAERKQEERSKRQKLAVERELDTARRNERTLKKKLRGTRKPDERKAVRDEYLTAVERRRRLTKEVNGETVPKNEDSEDEEEANLDERTREKIMSQAQEQREEMQESGALAKSALNVGALLRGVGEPRDNANDSDNDESSDEDNANGGTSYSVEVVGDKTRSIRDDDSVIDGAGVDEMALALFEDGGENMEGDGPAPTGRTIADIIMEKIREQEEARAKAAADAADPERVAMEQKIAKVYGLVGKMFSRYRAGKIPKPFKIIPKFKNWEELMYLTNPDGWSPAAMYQATRIFSSNLQAKDALRFYRDVLVPRCLDDIEENKKLNHHLYEALLRSAYKPDAFNKGVVFPLLEPSAITLRQAGVFGSVLSKVSIPMLHSAAALMFIAGHDWTPVNCVFVTVILNKGYALPYKVLDLVVDYFVREKKNRRDLPLAWHRCLLTFAQRYKSEIEMEQKEKLKFLMRVHSHAHVTPEIRRELFSARNRGDMMEPDASSIARAIANAE